jgi:putative flippase GtrA
MTSQAPAATGPGSTAPTAGVRPGPGPAAEDTRIRRQLPVFAAIGVASALAYVVIYVALRSVVPAVAANTVALAVTAVANTAANRRFTFSAHEAETSDKLMHQVKGGVAFLIGLALTNGSLLLLHLTARSPARWIELGVLIAANVAATATRFLLMRIWVFRG